MKSSLIFFSFLLLSFSNVVAQDVLYTVSNDPGSWGIRQITGINPNTGTGASAPVSYATADATTVSAAMALAANGYIYYIAQADETNGGAFTVRSISADPSTATPSAAVLSADINGAATDNASFRSMSAAPDGSIFMTVSDPNGIYLAKFQPGAGGSASGFELLGTITLDGAAPSDPLFRNGDIAFDGSGNLYALINEDAPQVQGDASIYFAPASALSTTAGGTTNMQTRYQVLNANNTNFSDFVVGLAVASSGNFYIAVQGGTQGGVYLLSRNGNGDFVVSATPVSAANALTIADLATGYFPTSTVLPVVYGGISAKIVNSSLIVDWSTLTETNNSGFEIEVSKDGQHFTKIGTVNTKAVGGNSDSTIDYSFSKTIDIPVAAMGISLFSLAFVLMLVNRKNKLLLSMMMVMGVGLTFTSCSKNSDQVDVDGESKLLVRIVQVDKDGKKSTSSVITAYKAN